MTDYTCITAQALRPRPSTQCIPESDAIRIDRCLPSSLCAARKNADVTDMLSCSKDLAQAYPAITFFTDAGNVSATVWPQLTSLRCLHNSISVMDASLATLPAVQSCDLSSNNISIVESLNACSSLTELILSNNSIGSVAQIGLCSGPLRRLILQVS